MGFGRRFFFLHGGVSLRGRRIGTAVLFCILWLKSFLRPCPNEHLSIISRRSNTVPIPSCAVLPELQILSRSSTLGLQPFTSDHHHVVLGVIITLVSTTLGHLIPLPGSSLTTHPSPPPPSTPGPTTSPSPPAPSLHNQPPTINHPCNAASLSSSATPFAFSLSSANFSLSLTLSGMLHRSLASRAFCTANLLIAALEIFSLITESSQIFFIGRVVAGAH